MFKFTSLLGKGLGRAKRAVTQGEIWFSSPLDFNDPFDCHPATAISGRREAMQDMFYRIMVSDGVAPVEATQRARHKAFVGFDDLRRDGETKRLLWSDLVRNKLSLFRIACLAHASASPLLWGHYADGHRGICIEYRFRDLVRMADHGGIYPLKVNYSDVRPVLNQLQSPKDSELTRTLIGTKQMEWAYEEEWRLFMPPDVAVAWQAHSGGQAISYPPGDAIAAVHLGAKISTERERDVRAWCDSLSPPLRCEKALLSDTDYRVVIPQQHHDPKD